MTRAGNDSQGDPEERDPGLARERTALSWTRTAISFAALGGGVGGARRLLVAPERHGLVLGLSGELVTHGRRTRAQVSTVERDQARVFAEATAITGIVLTKLDGSAKGGIVVAVQRELGVPVKFVGLGEGADDLAPFDPVGFVDSLVGEA